MSDKDQGKKNSLKHEPIIETASHGAHEEHSEGNWLVSYADMMTLLVGFFAILLSFSTMDPKKFDEAKKSVTEEFGGTYKIPYAKLAEQIREALKNTGLGDQVVIKQSEAGVEISFYGTVFFDFGSADLKTEAVGTLETLLSKIMDQIKDFDVVIEGHTDDVPLSPGARFRNNWELSSLRACRVLDRFLKAGVAKERLTALGYGEARPILPNRDESGNAIPENMTQNRRVVIKLLKPATPALTSGTATEASIGEGKASDSAAATSTVPDKASDSATDTATSFQEAN